MSHISRFSLFNFRINTLDRDVLSCMNYEDVQKFYESLYSFTETLNAESSILRFRLHPGTVMITDNWR